MKQEAEENKDADNLERETVDKLNSADSLIFQTEKQIKEFDEKLSKEDKDLLVTDLDLLKSAYSEKDLEITESTEKLNATWATISTKM
jgi:molecular chaperone DnaK